ncbi:MAG: hypothetical protein ACR2O3_01715 [Rhizobiaceae bacterium]
MLFQRFAKIIIFLCVFLFSFDQARAESIQFHGFVFPPSQQDVRVVDHPERLVSFTDQVALAFPLDFGIDGNIRVFNDFGDIVPGLQLLSLARGEGVTTQVAVVDLTPGLRQTFLLCDGNRCIRYNVVRN